MKSKPIGALFGVLTLVVILAIAPPAFAQQSQTTVNIAAGDGAGPDCSQTKNCFNPDVLNVAPGTTVVWQNNDKVSHTVTSGNPSDNQTGTIFDSSLIPAGKSFTFTFNNPGTYNYFCQVHPWMTGEVIVGTTSASTTGSSMSGSSSMNMPSGSSMSGSSSSVNMSESASVSAGATSSSMPSSSSMGTSSSTTSSTPSTGAPSSTSQNMTTSTSAPAQPTTTQYEQNYTQQIQQGGNQIAQQSSQGQQNGIPLGAPTNTQYTLGSGGIQEPSTAGSDPTPAYATGIAVIAIMAGIGVWSAVRRK